MIVQEQGVSGPEEMQRACLYGGIAKNRRPGRTGHSPRACIFGCDEVLPVSGLDHYLEAPQDAHISIACTDPVWERALRIRTAALKAVVELDHADKWKQLIQTPARVGRGPYLPGEQVFRWKTQKASSQTIPTAGQGVGRSQRIFGRWAGVGIIVGREWDKDHETSADWVSHGGICKLVAAQHLRTATLEERYVADKVSQIMQQAACDLSNEKDQKWEDLRRAYKDKPKPEDFPPGTWSLEDAIRSKQEFQDFQ